MLFWRLRKNSDHPDAGSHGGAAWDALQHCPLGGTSRPRAYLKDCPGEPTMQELKSVPRQLLCNSESKQGAHCPTQEGELTQTNIHGKQHRPRPPGGASAKPPRLAAPQYLERTETPSSAGESGQPLRGTRDTLFTEQGAIWACERQSSFLKCVSNQERRSVDYLNHYKLRGAQTSHQTLKSSESTSHTVQVCRPDSDEH